MSVKRHKLYILQIITLTILLLILAFIPLITVNAQNFTYYDDNQPTKIGNKITKIWNKKHQKYNHKIYLNEHYSQDLYMNIRDLKRDIGSSYRDSNPDRIVDNGNGLRISSETNYLNKSYWNNLKSNNPKYKFYPHYIKGTHDIRRLNSHTKGAFISYYTRGNLPNIFRNSKNFFYYKVNGNYIKNGRKALDSEHNDDLHYWIIFSPDKEHSKYNPIISLIKNIKFKVYRGLSLNNHERYYEAVSQPNIRPRIYFWTCRYNLTNLNNKPLDDYFRIKHINHDLKEAKENVSGIRAKKNTFKNFTARFGSGSYTVVPLYKAIGNTNMLNNKRIRHHYHKIIFKLAKCLYRKYGSNKMLKFRIPKHDKSFAPIYQFNYHDQVPIFLYYPRDWYSLYQEMKELKNYYGRYVNIANGDLGV